MSQRVRWSEFWFLYGQTIRQMGRPTLWLPLIIHALLAFGLVQMHLYLFSPASRPLIEAWIQFLKPDIVEAFFHYPTHFVFLPFVFGSARLLLNIFIEALLYGVLIDMLIAVYRGGKPAFLLSFKNAAKRYLSLTVVWFVVIAILYLVNVYFSDFVEGVIGYSLQNAPRRQMLVSGIVRILTILIYMPFVFVLPGIMAGKESLWQSLKQAFSVFGRHPFIALGLVLVPFVIGVIPSWASGEAPNIVSNFYPEMVYYILLVSIGIDVIVNFILMGTAVKFYMDQSD